MMKTAMQQLIEWAKVSLPDKYLHMVIEKAKELLPIEQQQLEDATADGFRIGFDNGTDYGKSKH